MSAIQTQAQSGWTKGKGELFTKLSYSQFASDDYYNLSGNKVNTSEFRQKAIGIYAEYGLSDRFTLLMDWPVRVQGFETTENITDIGDLKIGVKYALSKRIPISISIIPELPLAKSNNFATNKINTFEEINLPTGDGEFNVYSVLAISHSFHPIPIYINFYGIYNFRTSYESAELSDQLVEGIEVGWQPIDRIWLKTGAKLQQTLSNSNPTVSFVRGEGTEYTSIFGGVFFQITEKWGVDANVFGYLDGPQKQRNIYSGPTVNIGVVYELK